jgi:hypothetical protein
LASADRGLNEHRNRVRAALIALLTETVTDKKEQEVLRRVFGPATTFDKPILNFENPNLARLVNYGIKNVVWETPACGKSERSVLKPIGGEEIEPLLELLGICHCVILVYFFLLVDFICVVGREHVHAQQQDVV